MPKCYGRDKFMIHHTSIIVRWLKARIYTLRTKAPNLKESCYTPFSFKPPSPYSYIIVRWLSAKFWRDLYRADKSTNCSLEHVSQFWDRCPQQPLQDLQQLLTEVLQHPSIMDALC